MRKFYGLELMEMQSIEMAQNQGNWGMGDGDVLKLVMKDWR